MNNKKASYLTLAAIITLYVVLTYLSNAFGLANGAIQFRLSEALTILPFFTPAAIPGLAIGCFLSNLLTGCVGLDIVLGTLATLLGAVGSYYLRRFKFGSYNSTSISKHGHRTLGVRNSLRRDRWILLSYGHSRNR